MHCKSGFFVHCYILVLALILNSCSPPVQSPPTIPQKWSSVPFFYQDDAKVLPELAWWQEFHDPQLDQLMQEALHHNNDINIATENLHYAQTQLKQVQLNWVPGMSFSAGYSQMPNLGNPGYFWGLFPLYTLNAFQQLKDQQEATYRVQVQQYAKDSIRLTVIGQVAASYFTLLAEKEALSLYQALLSQQEHYLNLRKTQYKTGIISADLLDKAQQDVQMTQAQMAITQHNIHVAQNALRFLMNQNPLQEGKAFSSGQFSLINSQTIIPGNYPATVLNNRPDIQQARAGLEAASANINATAFNLLPSIRLDAWLGDTSAVNGVHLGEAYASIPLWSPQTFGGIKVSQAQYKVLYAVYVKTIRQALRDVENDLSAYSAYEQQLENTKKALLQKNKRCELAHFRHQYGIDSGVHVTYCQIQKTQLQLMLSQRKLEKMMTIVALYQDLAGGYRADAEH